MKQKPTLPSTLLGLRAWLKGSVDGKAMLGELTEKAIQCVVEKRCKACQDVRPRPKQLPKVLVVQQMLGSHPGVTVYAEEGVLVRTRELPACEAGSLAEEYIELMLPRTWKKLMGLPAKRIRHGTYRGVSLTEWLYYAELGEAIREIWKVRATLTKEEG